MNPLANPENMIVNTSMLDVADCEDNTTTIINNTSAVEIVNLELTKEASCDWVLPGGIVSYCVTINNPSSMDFLDTVFRDTLTSRLSFITGSFTVNGVSQTPTVVGNTIEYGLDILANQEVVICFRARVSHNA